MSFGDAVKACFEKYADFSGRAARPEYWWFYLFTLLVEVVLLALSLVGGAIGTIGLILLLVFALGVIVPGLAVGVRRLHDTGRAGWWLLISLVPFGGLVLLFFLASPGTVETNQHGAPV